MYKQLCEYQRRAVDFVLKHSFCGVCIAPDMGKEVIGLGVIWQLRFDYFVRGKVLIIVERGLEERWKQELSNENVCGHIRFASLHGNNEEKQRILQSEKDVYFADNNTLVWIIEQEKWLFDIVIIDDLSSYRNIKAKHFRELYQQHFRIERLIGFLPENHRLEDLWAEWLLIDGGRSLGMHKEAFIERYFFRGRHKLEAKNDARSAIYGMLSNTLYRVEDEEIADMPQELFKNLYIELDAGEYSKYQWFEKGNHYDLDLMQLANGIWCDNSGKGHNLHIRKVKELIKICALHRGRRVLVLYWFPHDAFLIRENIKDAVQLRKYDDVLAWREGRIQMGIIPAMDDKICDLLGYSVDVLVWFSLNEAKDRYNELNRKMLSVGSRTWVYHLIVKGTVDEELAGCYIE